MDRKDIVTSSLGKFLKGNLLQASIGTIDDIVLTYLVGILEDVGNEDGFDVEDFSEMMEAYIPGFGDISSATVCEWIFQLSEKVLSACRRVELPVDTEAPVEDNKTTKEVCTNLKDIELPYTLPLSGPKRSEQEGGYGCTNGKRLELKRSMSAPAPRNTENSIRLLTEMFPDTCKVKVKRCLSDSDGDIEQAVQALLNLKPEQTQTGSFKNSQASSKSLHEMDSCNSADSTKLLFEMFPAVSEQQVRHCLSVANGNVHGASQVLLHLQESGQITEQESYALLPIQKSCIQNEADVKESLLQKYGFVDTDDDRKNHRPVEPKKEKKKMVRYINSQMVTTKGERFIETKKSVSEEMKKTYVNLKPARKYHFH